jgi:hypothetical protein
MRKERPNTVLMSGSAGLVGAEASRYFASLGSSVVGGGTKALAGEAEEVLRGAAGTTDAGEAQVEDVTGEVWGDGFVDDRTPEAIAALKGDTRGPLDSVVRARRLFRLRS